MITRRCNPPDVDDEEREVCLEMLEEYTINVVGVKENHQHHRYCTSRDRHFEICISGTSLDSESPRRAFYYDADEGRSDEQPTEEERESRSLAPGIHSNQ
jgi:hypothetical protein